MKRKLTKLFSLVMAVCLLACTAMTTLASARASDYFAATDVWATRTSGGSFMVEFDIDATHTMTEIGAKKIYIYEQQASGSYEIVKTFTSSTTSGMMFYDDYGAYGKVTYKGTSGTKYYATVALYCKDSSGAETLYEDTYIITA